MTLATRLTIAMVSLVLLTATAVGLLTYRNVMALAVPRGLDRIDLHARLVATTLQASVNRARADVNGFRASIALNDIMTASLKSGIDPAARTAEAELKARLASRFAAELAGKSDYAQFRVIGVADGGREIIRVDHSGPSGAIRVVPDAELQRKGDQAYFKEAIALPENHIYFSPVDLTHARVPSLRTAAPIYTTDGKAFGIVIINVDLRPAFASIRSNMKGGIHLYVVNEHGDYLLHPDHSREFGFEFGKPARVQEDFPEFVGLLAGDDATPRVMADRTGARFGVAWDSVRLADGPKVTVIETVPYAQVIAAATSIRDSSLIGGLIAVVSALGLAVVIARSLTRPLVQMTKSVKRFSGDGSIVMPAGGGPEIGVLADAFTLMATESQAKTGALKREIEERRRIFDTSPDLIGVTNHNRDFIQVSPSSSKILGYAPEEMIGHNAAEFIYPDHLGTTRNQVLSTRSEREPRSFENRLVHKNGRLVTMAWTGVWSEPAQQYLFIGRDVTEERLAEEKFHLAVEASPSGLVMIDAGGAIVLVNAETERLFGYPRQELIGQPVDILVPASRHGQHAKLRTDFTAQPEARRMGAGRDLYGRRKDGSEFPVEIGLNPIQTQSGLLVLSVIVDISERKRNEVAIREYAEREQLFIAAVESSNDAIVTKTLDGVITGWNKAAERLFGFTSQEAIGKRIDIIVPDELRDEVRGILAKIKGGEKVDNHETVRVHKDGRKIDVSLSVSPVKSNSGTTIGAAKVARDIGGRKKAQEALLESERMARAIIDTALDAFLQLDGRGIIIGWSPKAEEMFGWPPQEAIGQKLADLIIPPENRDAYSERVAQFLRDANKGILGRRYEAPSVRRDGKHFNTEVSLTALRRHDGYIVNAFVRDVTEKVAAEEQLKQAQKMESVGQLTGGIAHDFNNMLTVITGTIDILGDAVADKPELSAIAKLISEAADRGAELTGHLLAFARKQPLQPQETDINTLMIGSGKLLRPALGEHIEIETSLRPDVWPALVDPNQLSSALLNLAINARDAMPNGGKLTLETNNVVLDQSYVRTNADVTPGEYVLVAVSDTGQGIPEAIRDKIFEPFFTTKDVGRGTGLGLSMVYGFVKQSGGHIKVYSEEGHGTTFKIYLPRAGTEAESVASASFDSQTDGGNETILIVEDDALVRTSVTAQVQSLGYKTLSAANAAEALVIADRGTQFDLLFTDVIMPGKMNGRQLAEEMAKRRSPLKVLFTSGYTENAIIHHGRLDPGVLLLAKPYRKPELARMLRRALDGAETLPARVHQPQKSQAS